MPRQPGRVGTRSRGLGVPNDASAYICGPAAFMTDVRDALVAIGFDGSRIHTELFGALPPINPGVVGEAPPAPHPPVGAPRTGPLVTFARSGISTPFGTDVGNVLELAEACDVERTLELPFRRVSHLHHTRAVGPGVVLAGTARTARRRRSPHLLCRSRRPTSCSTCDGRAVVVACRWRGSDRRGRSAWPTRRPYPVRSAV